MFTLSADWHRLTPVVGWPRMRAMTGGDRGAVRSTWVAMAAILAIAAGLRLVDLAGLPPAHYRDVAATANDALRAAAGHPRLHYVYDEGLFANLMGAGFLVFGASDLTLRLPGAIAGILTCLGVARLGRALGWPRAGLLGAFILAVTPWHVVLSRSGFRAVLLPLVLAYAFAFLVEALRDLRLGRWVAGGALLGLAAHVYPAARFAPLILPIWLLAVLGGSRDRWRRAAPGIAACVGAAFLVTAPLLRDYLKHPEHVVYPHRVVSIWSPRLEPGSAGTLFRESLAATLGMFHLRGDANARHNLPGAPMLDPLSGALFLVGLVVAARGLPRPPAAGESPGAGALVLAWLVVMLLPTLFSVEGVPHGLRSAGAIPALVLLAGLGAETAGRALADRAGRRAAAALGLAAALVMTGATAYRYFVVWGRDPATVAAHDGAFRAAARTLLAAPPGVERFLVANGTGYPHHGHPAEAEVYLFEMRDAPPILLGARDAARLVLEGRPALVALIRRDDQVLEVIRSLNPDAPVVTIEAAGLSPESPVYRIN